MVGVGDETPAVGFEHRSHVCMQRCRLVVHNNTCSNMAFVWRHRLKRSADLCQRQRDGHIISDPDVWVRAWTLDTVPGPHTLRAGLCFVTPGEAGSFRALANPSHPPMRCREMVLGDKIKFINWARNGRPILGTFFFYLCPPPLPLHPPSVGCVPHSAEAWLTAPVIQHRCPHMAPHGTMEWG